MSLREALPKIVTGTLPGPKGQEIMDRRAKAVPNGIGTAYKAVIKRGEGAMFEDVDGNIFLDWIGGVGVLNIGYSNPECIEAVKEQADKFFHSMFNITTHEGYVALAEKMNEIVPVKGDQKKTMFVCSGSEADENAVKIARNYTGRPNIIVFTGAFQRDWHYNILCPLREYTEKQCKSRQRDRCIQHIIDMSLNLREWCQYSRISGKAKCQKHIGKKSD